MELFEELLSGRAKLSVTGLGYVGMPIAVAFSKKLNVIGYDMNTEKVKLYQAGLDPTCEVGSSEVALSRAEFTDNDSRLSEALFHIVAVPTPVNADHTPDLTPVISATKTVGRKLRRGAVVVYESTVYPGVTEDICVPLLEEASGLKCGTDFKVGYSPERINPGDKGHRLSSIVKIVSGMDEETLEVVSKVYSLIVEAGVYKAESIKVAEAAKVIENSQRDINIAFMNELSMIFHKMGIDTIEVLSAAATKWNFLNFRPGLVGGHCIGVDPFYLTYKAEQLGCHSQVILAGRRINDDMGKYIAQALVKKLIAADRSVKNACVGILGFTFKENCPDTRNTKVIDIISELNEYGISPTVFDPIADAAESRQQYGIELAPNMGRFRNLDALIIAVAHDNFSELSSKAIAGMFKDGKKIIFDIKGVLHKKDYADPDFDYWRL